MGHDVRYTDLTKEKEAFPMKMIQAVFNAPKSLSFETKQMLYGVSILLTFVVAGRLGMMV